MSHTEDFEYTLDLDNVVGVEYDEETDTVVTFVSSKVDEEDLDDDQIVANRVSDRDTDVIEIGEIRPHHDDMPEPKGDTKNRHRPVVGGVSECNANGTAATGGPYPVEVVDTDAATWWDQVDEGDRVRLSNSHVYAMSGQANLGQRIWQPSPYDGGTTDDEVGRLAGHVEIEDGVTVDVAARTTQTVDESDGYHRIDDKYVGSVYRDDYRDLKGETLIKTGRTTGVNEADVLSTTATVKVGYPQGATKMADMIVTDHMADGGDSGSPTFKKDSGELVGQVFAGTDRVTIHHKMQNVEEELGVRIVEESETEEDRTMTTSLDTTVTITMEESDLDLTGASGDEPAAGETTTIEFELAGNYPGKVWVEVQGERDTFVLEGDSKPYTATAPMQVTAPDEQREEFDVDVSGGYVEEE